MKKNSENGVNIQYHDTHGYNFSVYPTVQINDQKAYANLLR